MAHRRTTERLLNVIMTLGATSYGRTRAQLYTHIPDYRDATSDEARDRMFERDKRQIADLGFPLMTLEDHEEPSQTRYRIAADRTGGIHLDLSPEQTTLLLLAADALGRARRTGALATARAKVLALAPSLPSGEVAVAAQYRDDASGAIGPLLAALHTHGRVRFDYRAATTGALTHRTVDPWALATQGGHWYLLGYDHDRHDRRLFRLSRLTSVPHQLSVGSGDPPLVRAPDGASIAGAIAEYEGRTSRAPEDVTIDAAPYRALALRRAASQDDLTTPRFTVHIDPQEATEAVLHDPERVSIQSPPDVRAATRQVLARVGAMHVAPAPAADLKKGRARRGPALRVLRGAAEDLGELVAVAAYVAARPGVSLQEMATAFDRTEPELIRDFETLFVCGDLGTGFEDLIDMTWEGDRVEISNAETLTTPLSYSPAEIQVLAAGVNLLRSTLSGKAADDLADLARVLTDAVGDSGNAASDSPGREQAPAGDAQAELAATLSRAAVEHTPVDIVYSAPGGVSERVIEPSRLETTDGHTYVHAFCHLAGAERRFRLDRVAIAAPVDDDAARVGSQRESGSDVSQAVEYTVRLAPGAFWVAEAFGTREIRDLAEGRVLATIRTTAWPQLLDAVLTARGDAELLAPAATRSLVAEVAERAAARHAD